MTNDTADEMVTFRLGKSDRLAIGRLVEKGEFRNRSDFLRYAVKIGLREFEPGMRAKLDLELEGVDLAASQNPGARGRPPRTPSRTGRGGVGL